jgi:hypothetical protein
MLDQRVFSANQRHVGEPGAMGRVRLVICMNVAHQRRLSYVEYVGYEASDAETAGPQQRIQLASVNVAIEVDDVFAGLVAVDRSVRLP